MDFIRFVLSSFWTWLGFFLLVYIVLYGIAEVIKAFRRPRKLTVSTRDDLRIVEVDGASDGDIKLALNGEEVKEND